MGSVMPPDSALTYEQTRALLNILSHHEAYAELQDLKYPDAVTRYGFPFAKNTVQPAGADDSAASSGFSTPESGSRSKSPKDKEDRRPFSGERLRPTADDLRLSSSPMLQTLMTRFILHLPGLERLPRDFWAVRVQGLLARLGEAELSESYDKGALGMRKTLATAASSVLEMLGRGALAGVPKRGSATNGSDQYRRYDHSRAEDLELAWDDVIQGMVHGNLFNETFDHMAQTDDLEIFSPAVEASAKYVIVHLATFLHQVFVISPQGQYVLKLMENFNNLVPYKMMKQTLRMGNAATMLNAMMRLMLAKLGVNSLTNFIGLTQNADDGMNLLQRMISLVLSWDASEFKKTADRIAKARDRPSDNVLKTIRQFIDADRSVHSAVRAASEARGQSIITAILNAADPDMAATLTDAAHAQCLEYYAALLSVRDREAITAALCRQSPDLFTSTVRECVNAQEPIIRVLHDHVDLHNYLDDMRVFLDDFIKSSKPKKVAKGTGDNGGSTVMPTVEEYVDLLMRNRGILYKMLHGNAKKCPEIREMLRDWVNDVIVKFREEYNPQLASMRGGRPISMDERLNELYASLSPSSQQRVLAAINAHADYLYDLTRISQDRLQHFITPRRSSDTSGTMKGPGVYLNRWQDLLDETTITPATAEGAVRHGRDVRDATVMGTAGVGSAAMAKDTPDAPDVSVVVKEMAGGFLRILQEIGGPDY